MPSSRTDGRLLSQATGACLIADYGDVANVDQHDAYINWFFERGQRFRKAVEMAASQLRQD